MTARVAVATCVCLETKLGCFLAGFQLGMVNPAFYVTENTYLVGGLEHFLFFHILGIIAPFV
jgi:hypothetical protein